MWLRPKQNQIDELTEIISSLAHRFGTKPFPPHITLLANIPGELDTIKHACTKIVDQIQGFDIPLQKIAYSDAYYRNFYILAEITSPLLNVYKCAKIQLNYESDEKYMPHVSLLYGKLDNETKESLKKQFDSVYPKLLQCSRLDLYNSSGTIVDWHLVESYSFTNIKK